MKTSELITYLIIIVLCEGCHTSQNKLAEQFKNPPLFYHPNMNQHYTPEQSSQQDSIIADYLSNGYGGFTKNVNWTEDYLNNNKEMKSFFSFCSKAKAKGMDLWLYDENLYPSGMAGDYILAEHPEWEAEGILFKDTIITGPMEGHLKLLPGKPLILVAIPIIENKLQLNQSINLENNLKDSNLLFNVPSGKWKIALISVSNLYHGYQAGTERGGKIPRYPSLLKPEVTQRFIELTHKKYASSLGKKLGSLFFSTFTDEPSLMAQLYYQTDYGVYPWKDNLSSEIKTRYGYDLTDKLIPIMLDEGPEGQKLRYQYFKTTADLFCHNYFKQIKEFCQAQNFKSGGHLLLEESMMTQVPLYGDIFACYRAMNAPGVDVLSGMPELTDRYLYSGRMASSAADLNNEPVVMSEPCPVADAQFYNGKEAPTIQIRGMLNRLMVAGITNFNNYLKLENATPKEKKDFNTYLARVTYILTGGTRNAHLAVLYPIETMWTKYRPLPTWLKSFDGSFGGDPNARKIDVLFDSISHSLYYHQKEFSYIDTKALIDSKASHGKLVNGKLKWEVLILPSVETIPLEAWRSVQKFWEKGGTIIAVNSFPINSENEFPSKEIQAISERIFNSGKNKQGGQGIFIPDFNKTEFISLIEKIDHAEPSIQSNGTPILCSHKIKDGHDLFFIANDSKLKTTITISFPTKTDIEKWDPKNGMVTKLPHSNKLSIDLDEYEGTLLRMKHLNNN